MSSVSGSEGPSEEAAGSGTAESGLPSLPPGNEWLQTESSLRGEDPRMFAWVAQITGMPPLAQSIARGELSQAWRTIDEDLWRADGDESDELSVLVRQMPATVASMLDRSLADRADLAANPDRLLAEIRGVRLALYENFQTGVRGLMREDGPGGRWIDFAEIVPLYPASMLSRLFPEEWAAGGYGDAERAAAEGGAAVPMTLAEALQAIDGVPEEDYRLYKTMLELAEPLQYGALLDILPGPGSEDEEMAEGPELTVGGIPMSRQRSVEDLTARIQTMAQEQKQGKTKPKALALFDAGLAELNAKPGKDPIDPGAAMDLYHERAKQRGVSLQKRNQQDADKAKKLRIGNTAKAYRKHMAAMRAKELGIGNTAYDYVEHNKKLLAMRYGAGKSTIDYDRHMSKLRKAKRTGAGDAAAIVAAPRPIASVADLDEAIARSWNAGDMFLIQAADGTEQHFQVARDRQSGEQVLKGDFRPFLRGG